VNISAAVALAGLGFDRTRLRIFADPTIQTHVVEVEAEGAFGRFRFVEDVAVSEHRKTGRIVAMALIKTLRQMSSALVVGG
jgi:aspartate dehydrogenase